MARAKKVKPLRISYALAVHDDRETQRVIKVLKEHRTNMGRETLEFEKKIAKLFGKKYGIMVNSGSSANLIAVELLNLPEGSEVITPMLTFSTTVAPLVKRGLIPVFTDVREGTYVINEDQVEKLITKRTKALMVPLLFGSIPNMEKLSKIARKHKLLLIEDSCDTLGAKYNDIPTGKYSDLTTTSFFGAHIITTGGNGGLVSMNNPEWRDKAKMLRGWGRTSSLFGESEDIKKRFGVKIDGIEYDAKFIFEMIGYNLLPNEMCAAFGNVQLEKLPKFRKRREKNFVHLVKYFKKYEEFFILPLQDKKVRTQWMAFPLTIKKGAPFKRLELMTYLEKQNVQTRPVFTGNIMRQPGFKKIKHRLMKEGYSVTNEVMERGFVIGCHHGIHEEHLARIEEVFDNFLKPYN